MKLIYPALALAGALTLAPYAGYAAPPPAVRFSVAVCDPNAPASCGVPGIYVASGIAPVTAALASATQTATFKPIAGRGFNVSAWGTFVASYQLERSFDSGVTWLPITAGGTQLYVWSAPASEQAEETEFAVQYRVNVTSYTSGTLNIRLSQ